LLFYEEYTKKKIHKENIKNMSVNDNKSIQCMYCMISLESVEEHKIGCKYYIFPIKNRITAVILTIICSPFAIIVGGTCGFIICSIVSISRLYKKFQY